MTWVRHLFIKIWFLIKFISVCKTKSLYFQTKQKSYPRLRWAIMKKVNWVKGQRNVGHFKTVTLSVVMPKRSKCPFIWNIFICLVKLGIKELFFSFSWHKSGNKGPPHRGDSIALPLRCYRFVQLRLHETSSATTLLTHVLCSHGNSWVSQKCVEWTGACVLTAHWKTLSETIQLANQCIAL